MAKEAEDEQNPKKRPASAMKAPKEKAKATPSPKVKAAAKEQAAAPKGNTAAKNKAGGGAAKKTEGKGVGGTGKKANSKDDGGTGKKAEVMKKPMASQDAAAPKKTKLEQNLESFALGLKSGKGKGKLKADYVGEVYDEDEGEEGEEEEVDDDEVVDVEDFDPNETAERSKSNRFNEDYKNGTLPQWAKQYYETHMSNVVCICFRLHARLHTFIELLHEGAN